MLLCCTGTLELAAAHKQSFPLVCCSLVAAAYLCLLLWPLIRLHRWVSVCQQAQVCDENFLFMAPECGSWFPKGIQINYSSWSFASTHLRWQHMRGINLCNTHKRTCRCPRALGWVRGAHIYTERQITHAHHVEMASCRVTKDADSFTFNRCKGWKSHRNSSLFCFCSFFVVVVHQTTLIWSENFFFYSLKQSFSKLWGNRTCCS